MKKSFIREVASKYPSRYKLKHGGDSYLLYETGPRSTDYPPDEAFEDFVEENEGEAEATLQIDLNQAADVKREEVTDDSRGYPEQGSWDKKVLAETLYDEEVSKDPLLSKIKPTVKEVVETARTLRDPAVRNQLIQMLHADPVWLQDAQGLIRQWLGWTA